MSILYCKRCGSIWNHCVHPESCRFVCDDPAIAEGIKARYELGKLFNPDHDTTGYYLSDGSPRLRR